MLRFKLGIFAVAVFCVSLLAPAGTGLAQEAEQERKTRQVEALSERVHRRLAKAQEAMDAEDYATAEALLQETRELRNISPYERALTERVQGFVHLYQEDYPASIEIFLQIIQSRGPDEIGGIYNELIGLLGQLYMVVEDFREAVRFGEMSLELNEDPSPTDYYRLVQANLRLEEWREVLKYGSLTIDKARATGVPVEENWHRAMLYAHWEIEEYGEALAITKILLAEWPKKDYWTQMSALYSFLEDDTRLVSAYWCAYDQGLLSTSSELVGMANYFMMVEVPYKAAVILHNGLEDGSIESNVRNLKLAAQAWQFAREDRKALDPLRKAAESEEDMDDRGDLYMHLAEIHNVLGDFGDCASAARQALRVGDLKSEGRTYMLLGQCLLEQDEFDGAGDAFSQAIRDSDTRRDATRWQNYLKNEVERRRKLEADLARYAD